jgi:hypothetical protein
LAMVNIHILEARLTRDILSSIQRPHLLGGTIDSFNRVSTRGLALGVHQTRLRVLVCTVQLHAVEGSFGLLWSVAPWLKRSEIGVED